MPDFGPLPCSMSLQVHSLVHASMVAPPPRPCSIVLKPDVRRVTCYLNIDAKKPLTLPMTPLRG